MAAPTSQRLSFTQLVLDMGLADKKALLKAKKLIKEREAEGQKLTVARACVELEILTEKQAKRVQLELKRLKEGLASSQELTAATEEDAAVAAKAEAKRQAAKKKQKEAKAEAAKEAEAAEGEKPSKAGKVDKPGKGAKGKAAKDEAAEDEADEPKGKKGPAKRGKAEPKGKVKLGKEIELDSQRQAKATPGPKRTLGSGAARRGVGGRKQSGEGPAPGAKKKSNTPYIALGGAVVLLLVIAGVVALSGDGKQPTDQAGTTPTPDVVTPPEPEDVPGGPSPDVGPIQTPPPEQPSDDRTKWTPAQKLREAERQIDRLALDADDEAAKGRFAKAIELLEEFPQDLRDQEPWVEIGARDLAKYKKLLPVQERFEAALAQAGDDPEPLEAMVLEMLGPKYEFAGEGFLRDYKARAEEALGEDVYTQLELKAEELALAATLDDFQEDIAEENAGDVEIMTAQAVEVRLRGTPERHQQFMAAVPQAKANLEKAKQVLADREAAEKERLADQEKKALKAAKRAKLMTDDGKSCDLTAFTDHGFTIEVGKEEITYGWGNCPPKLGHAVKLLGIDAKSAEEVYQLGIWSLTRAAFDLAEADFKQAVRLDSSYQAKIPDIEQLKHFTKLFRGRHSIGAPGEATQVKWEFKADRPQEVRDFKAMHEQMQVELVGGQLKISAPQGFLITGAQVRGAWQHEAKLTVVPASNNPAPIVVFSSEGGAYQVRLGQKTELFSGFLGDGEALASSDARAMPGSRAEVGVKVSGEKATVTVKLDGAQVISHEVPFQGELEFSIGARGAGEARFAGIEANGILADGWSERTLASAPNLITRALREAERQRESQAGGEAVGVPVAYLKTSAEDEVALEGIPPETIAIVNEGRQLLEAGNQWGAFQKFREAAERNIEYHAANYLYAASQTRSDPQGALIRLQRCVDGVQDFYEAMVAKAEALFWLGRFDKARKALDEALALRPDYAPAHLTDANLSVAELDYVTALGKLKLAQVLAPGDPVIEMYYGQVTALAEGPAWSNRARFTNDFYRLDTDMVSFGDKFLKQLTLMRTALEESFPILINPEAPKRQASILVFGEAEGYYSYSERTGVGRAEDSLGHFNLWSGQLLLFLEREPTDWNAFHVIFHEGTHQWCYSQGLALPYWFNEGVAEYMGGTQLAMDGSRIIKKGQVSSFLKQRIQGLIANWDQREKTWFDIMTQSPEQFYSGNQSLKYAQGWTIVHFIMESGDETLKKTLWKYLQYFVDAAKGDPSEKKETRGSSKLEHIYVDTFHQLDMKDVEARWVKWVEKLAKECGIDWTAPEEKKE